MKLQIAPLLAMLALFIPASIASAATIRVPGDQPTIQAALAVAGSGDRILIAKGVYPGGIEMTGKTGIILEGKGRRKTVIQGSLTAGLSMVQCVDVIVRGLGVTDVDGAGVILDSCRDVRIENCSFERTGIDGVLVSQGSGILLSGNRISDCGGSGISLAAKHSVARNNRILRASTGISVGAPRCVVTGNRILDPIDTGLSTSSAGATTCLFSDNQILANGASGAGHGLFLGANSIVARNNTVTGFGGIGIITPADGSLVLGNSIDRCGNIGIHVDGNGAVLGGNSIDNSGGHGVKPAGGPAGGRSLVLNNWIRGAGGSGVFVNTRSNTFIRNSVLGSSNLDLLDVGTANVYLGNEFGTSN